MSQEQSNAEAHGTHSAATIDADDTNIPDDATSEPSETIETVVEQPTIRPTLIWLALTFIVGIAAYALVRDNQAALGGPDVAVILTNAIVFLIAVAVLRLLVRTYVLSQTEYIVTDAAIRHEYSLLMRTFSRRVPLSMVRSNEMRQSRVQRLLGYGTITVNRGLGDIELRNVPDPHALRDTIHERTAATDQSATT